MKATAIAPANIAFIKYWGRKDAKLRLPYNASISMNLSACTTTTTVKFSDAFEKDMVTEGFDEKRIIAHIDRLRKLAGVQLRAKISTKNSFPKSAGIASSASGFAALTVAATAALGLKLSEKELTALARLGSGSASRSIPDGFVKWDGEYARSLYPPDYWDIRDIIVIVQNTAKDVPTSIGHETVQTSPFFNKRLEALPGRIQRLERALQEKNFQAFGEVIEEECLDMHHVMQTQDPPLYYWNISTDQIIKMVKSSGLPVYFTVDAGPNVHFICEAKVEQKLIELLKGREIIINKPAKGAYIL